MSPFPRDDYRALERYHFDRTPVDLDLSDNTNRWGAHPDALAVLSEAGPDDLSRYPDLYADGLAEVVSEVLEVPQECVTTGCGSDDVLDSLYRAAAGTGELVTAATPTFSMAEPLARMNGMGFRPVAWADALADPGRLFEGEPSVAYVCRPCNPTGELAPTAWVERLVEAKGRALLVLDEAYVDFGGDSFAGLAARTPGVAVTRTLSKAYGLAGLRVGYAIASPKTALEADKARGPYKVGRVAAAAARAALLDASGWTRRTVDEARDNRRRLTSELERRGLEPLASWTNFVLFRASGGAPELAAALRARGVAVRPFPGGYPDGGDAVRVTVAPWSELERFLDALDAVLEGGAA